MSYAPYWWRFWQCLHKWYSFDAKLQLLNAAKYFSKFGPATAFLIFRNGKNFDGLWYAYFTTQMITTVFCLYWDYYWDWGLLRGTTSSTLLLRDSITFSPSFYYFAVVLNTLLRFWWLLMMVVATGGTAEGAEE